MIAPGCICTCSTFSTSSSAEATPDRDCDCAPSASTGAEGSDVTCRMVGSGDLVPIRPAPTYSPGTMIEHTMRSRRKVIIRFIWTTEQEDLRQRGLLCWNRMSTEHACETDVTRGSLIAQNM
jgi:hypothetical protein